MPRSESQTTKTLTLTKLYEMMDGCFDCSSGWTHQTNYKKLVSKLNRFYGSKKTSDEPQTTNPIQDFLERLIKEHEEFCRNWNIVGIVDGYKGAQEDSRFFEKIYVEQSGALTDAGDDFFGSCYIEIAPGKYLKTEYYT